MLVSEDDVNNYNKIKSGLDRLRVLVEQSELWIFKKKDLLADNQSDSESSRKNSTSSDAENQSTKKQQKMPRFELDEEDSNDESTPGVQTERQVLQELELGPHLNDASVQKYKELYKILKSMIKLCTNEERLPNGQVINKPRKNDQRLLRNMGVHNVVLDLTKISYDKKADHRMRIIMQTAHEFLQMFCYQNPHNQLLLHEKVDFTNYPSNEWEAKTATYIFKDNSTLCNDINERLVQNFVHEIENQNGSSDDHVKIPYLEFLQTICVVNDSEIRKNQDMIVDELVSSELLAYWNDKIMNSDEICALMEKEYYQHTDGIIRDSSLLLHINLVKLLINCTTGKNTFTEIKCHTILALEDIEKVVSHKYCMIELKDVYIKFLYHCHIDTENETKEIFTQTYIWSLMETFILDINFYLFNNKTSFTSILNENNTSNSSTNNNNNKKMFNKLFESYINENVIQIIIGFFSHNQFNQMTCLTVRYLTRSLRELFAVTDCLQSNE